VLNSNNSIKWQTGWGTNLGLIASAGQIFDPPFDLGFNGGSTGGPSSLFTKPTYQKGVPGKMRQVPDISWLADPYTGAIIEITLPFIYPQVLETIGGTSVACPMFSALWAIANQEAGVPLGQAAPYLYSMPKSTITDVLAVNSTTNVTDWIYTSAKHADKFNSPAIIGPLENTKAYVTAIWDYPDTADTPYVLSFGTDSGLTVTAGWDNVTGLGTPNGKAFADYFNPAK
jgi:subtilase family serine protease